MKIFKITDRIEIVCESERTRYGFRHLATLFVDGHEADKGKCCYYNRTWESYEFQSVLFEVVRKSKTLNEDEKKICKSWIECYRESNPMFKSVAMVAMMGDVLCKDQKEKNDWKARMIKAGLGNSGVQMPEDWDSLDEQTKQERLDKVIACMAETK